jgi:hypothetical protein
MDSGLAASRRSGMALMPILSPTDACKLYFLQRVYSPFPKLLHWRCSHEIYLYSRKQILFFVVALFIFRSRIARLFDLTFTRVRNFIRGFSATPFLNRCSCLSGKKRTACVVIAHSSGGITNAALQAFFKKSERDSFMIVKRRRTIPLPGTMLSASLTASAATPQRPGPNSNVVMVSFRYYPF